MQIYFKQNLAMLAVPKTGSTAYEMALRPKADVIFSGRRKHLGLTKYHRQIAPFLKSAFDQSPERLAVMREPVDQLRSWYRYRARKELRDSPRSTHGMSFDTFVEAVISPDPPAFARIGSQHKVLTLPDGSMPLHHLFAYENQVELRDFLESRFASPLKLAQRNVSPPLEAPLSRDIEDRLRALRSSEFALYERLDHAGGHLVQEFD